MKKLTILLIIVLLFVLVVAAGCSQELGEETSDSQTQAEELSDEQLLEENPDYLDEALQELDEIE